MAAQVYTEDGEFVIDKGNHKIYLDRDEATEVALQLSGLINTDVPSEEIN